MVNIYSLIHINISQNQNSSQETSLLMKILLPFVLDFKWKVESDKLENLL